MFKSLGVLQSAEVDCKTVSDFSTTQRTREIFTEALGRVLFIDEAYRFVSVFFLHLISSTSAMLPRFSQIFE
jgi:hypothetical protein